MEWWSKRQHRLYYIDIVMIKEREIEREEIDFFFFFFFWGGGGRTTGK